RKPHAAHTPERHDDDESQLQGVLERSGHGVTVASVAWLLLTAQPPQQILRPLAPPTAAAEIGVETRTDGATAVVAPSPGFALVDLAMYDQDVSTVFPFSAPHFPADSLGAARRARARAWRQ